MSNDENNTNPPSGFVLSGPLYEKVKWLVTIVLPALTTLFFTFSVIFGWPHTDQIMGAGAAVTTFLGVILGISTNSFRNSPNRYAGETYLIPTDDGWKRVFNMTADEIDPNKKEVSFKVIDTHIPPSA